MDNYEDVWYCSCGAHCIGKFCSNCGAKRPAAENTEISYGGVKLEEPVRKKKSWGLALGIIIAVLAIATYTLISGGKDDRKSESEPALNGSEEEAAEEAGYDDCYYEEEILNTAGESIGVFASWYDEDGWFIEYKEFDSGEEQMWVYDTDMLLQQYMEGKDDSETWWFYNYDDSGRFVSRKMSYTPEWKWSEKPRKVAQYEKYTMVLDEPAIDCVGFEYYEEISDVEFGHPYGDFVLCVKTLDGKWEEIDRFRIEEDGSCDMVLEFDSPISFTEICSIPENHVNAASYSTRAGIYDLTVVSYDFDV